MSLKDTEGPDQKVALQAWLAGRAPDRGREVAARTSQASEDRLSHDLTRPGVPRHLYRDPGVVPVGGGLRQAEMHHSDQLARPRMRLLIAQTCGHDERMSRKWTAGAAHGFEIMGER